VTWRVQDSIVTMRMTGTALAFGLLTPWRRAMGGVFVEMRKSSW
jgi:hypothetical protein